jgi:hypothetical protein
MPKIGPRIGHQSQYWFLKLKTAPPYPTMAVRIRGPRSRAGLRAAPVFMPRAELIPRTVKNIPTGTTPGGAGPFFLSVNMKIPVMSMADPINYIGSSVCIQLKIELWMGLLQ